MSETRVHLSNLRQAPRKVRLVADLIRGRSASEAETILRFAVKRPALPLVKLLKSGVSAALQKGAAREESLVISQITVDEGPKLKRAMPRAQGRSYAIQKKTSHVTIVLKEKEQAPVRASRKKPAARAS